MNIGISWKGMSRAITKALAVSTATAMLSLSTTSAFANDKVKVE